METGTCSLSQNYAFNIRSYLVILKMEEINVEVFQQVQILNTVTSNLSRHCNSQTEKSRRVAIIQRAIATQSTAVPLWDKAPLLVAPKFGNIF